MPRTTQTILAEKGRLTIGVADLKVSNDPAGELVTHALGSCIGVTVFDPVASVGGMLHFMLPSSSIDKTKAELKPAMFADTGIPLLFRSCYELGAVKGRLIVIAAGGAEVMKTNESSFRIGTRNRTILRKLFWKNDVLLAADETGGNISRTMKMSMADGAVRIFHKGEERLLWPE